jgi:hypothetical protein
MESNGIQFFFYCRSKGRNLPNEKTLPPKQTDEERPSVSRFRNKAQDTTDQNEAHECSSCKIKEHTNGNLTDDLTAFQKKLEDVDKLVAETDML